MKITIKPEVIENRPIVVEEGSVTITLSKSEAAALASIVGKVGGSKERLDVDGMFCTLLDYVGRDNYYSKYATFCTGSITFLEIDKKS